MERSKDGSAERPLTERSGLWRARAFCQLGLPASCCSCGRIRWLRYQIETINHAQALITWLLGYEASSTYFHRRTLSAACDGCPRVFMGQPVWRHVKNSLFAIVPPLIFKRCSGRTLPQGSYLLRFQASRIPLRKWLALYIGLSNQHILFG